MNVLLQPTISSDQAVTMQGQHPLMRETARRLALSTVMCKH